MPVIPYADFLAGAILSLVIPVGLLIAVTTWYHIQVRRVPGPPPGAPAGSTPETPHPANPTTGGQKPTGEASGSTPAGT